jgi:hypothetical protein
MTPGTAVTIWMFTVKLLHLGYGFEVLVEAFHVMIISYVGLSHNSTLVLF